MEILFAGASGTVPATQIVVKTNDRKNILLDIGDCNSPNSEAERRLTSIYPIAPDINAIILTHAHFDHFAKLPQFVKFGYRGPAFATSPSIDIMKISGRKSSRGIEEGNIIVRNIQKGTIGLAENEYLARVPTRPDEYDDFIKSTRYQRIRNVNGWKDSAYPLIDKFSDLVTPVDFYKPFNIGKTEFTLFKSSHILGSAEVLMKSVEQDGLEKRILFTGDLGYENCFYDAPDVPENIDYLIIDTTNGDRDFNSDGDLQEELKEIINKTIKREGQVYIAAFAIDRLQKILYHIKELYNRKEIPTDIPYVVNSITGSRIIHAYLNNPDYFRSNIRNRILESRESDDMSINPIIINPKHIISKSYKRARAHVNNSDPYVVLSPSGMFMDGRIQRYLRKDKNGNRGIADPRNSVVILGYQAEEVGQRLIASMQDNSVNDIKLGDTVYPINAEIYRLNNTSSHIFRNQMLEFIIKTGAKKVFLVHAEHNVREKFKEYLWQNQVPVEVVMPNLYSHYKL